VYVWAFLNSQGVLLDQYGEPMRYVTLSGLILFSPLMIFPTAVLSFLGPAVSTDVRNLFMLIALPLMGAVIGTVFWYAVEWWEKSGASGMITPFRKT
jgi:membrane protein DedA with SNARE-associated domain